MGTAVTTATVMKAAVMAATVMAAVIIATAAMVTAGSAMVMETAAMTMERASDISRSIIMMTVLMAARRKTTIQKVQRMACILREVSVTFRIMR